MVLYNKNISYLILTNMRITDKLYDILFIHCKLKSLSHYFVIYMS